MCSKSIIKKFLIIFFKLNKFKSKYEKLFLQLNIEIERESQIKEILRSMLLPPQNSI